MLPDLIDLMRKADKFGISTGPRRGGGHGVQIHTSLDRFPTSGEASSLAAPPAKTSRPSAYRPPGPAGKGVGGLRLHGARATPEHLRDLSLAQVLVGAQHDNGALSRWQRLDRGPDLVAIRRTSVEAGGRLLRKEVDGGLPARCALRCRAIAALIAIRRTYATLS